MRFPMSLASAQPEVRFPVLHMPKLELCFTDGSLLLLRQLSTDPMRRNFEHQGKAHEVDLSALEPLLREEVYHAPEGDRPAIIFFTLRHRYKTAQAFVEAVQQSAASSGAVA